VTPSAAVFGYSTTGAVLTLVLPLGLFIVIMIVVYLVFGRRRAVPERRTIAGAKPVAPDPQAARNAAAAAGFPNATSAGGVEPLADRATPPKVGARRDETPADGDDTAVIDTGGSDAGVGDAGVSDSGASDSGVSDSAAGETAVEDPE
jgi:hypothetical protein